nr:patatin-like phospholipase family protein [Acidiferrobacterales bacterium]
MSDYHPRRSLILAGGGLKVAFQAGVLQVWLDEAGLEFEHVDGASGGTFNLAMLCQGMTGTEIANNWRSLPILRGISPNWLQLLKGPFARSLLKYDRWRKNIFSHWNLDFKAIQQSEIDATFNLYNFTKHRLEVITAADLTPDKLTACVSLPTWFPPVEIDNELFIDSVYMTDANLIEAAKWGVDELWIIWTVSKRSVWKSGLIHNYFQVIETAANGRLHADIARIEKSNRLIANGQHGEFGKHIEIKILNAEVPLHYLINFSSKKFTEAVELGIQEGRRWCTRNRIPNAASDISAAHLSRSEHIPAGLSFTETMRGAISVDGNDTPLSVTLTISIEDVNRFVVEPSHLGDISGTATSALWGGTRVVKEGKFNLFIDTSADTKKMRYVILFNGERNEPFTLFGEKEIRDDSGFDVWQDTTTLFT